MAFQPPLPMPAEDLPQLSNVAQSTPKVASTRRASAANAKTKQKTSGLKRSGAVADVRQMPKKRGRSAGIPNYNSEEVEALQDVVEEVLPVGPKGWNEVAQIFSKWSEENDRPICSAKSIEIKHKQVWFLFLINSPTSLVL